MYIPSSFQESDIEKLHEFIDGHGFAMLITAGGDGSIASHLPITFS